MEYMPLTTMCLLDPLTGNRMTFFGTTMQAGDIAVVDQNGDYNIDYNDKVSLGNPDRNIMAVSIRRCAGKEFHWGCFVTM